MGTLTNYFKQEVLNGNLPGLAVLIVGGVADPEKTGRRKDIDLLVVTDTKPRSKDRKEAIQKLIAKLKSFFLWHGMIPRLTMSDIEQSLLYGDQQEGMRGEDPSLRYFLGILIDVGEKSGKIRPIDVFIQGVNDLSLKDHLLQEKKYGRPFVLVLNTIDTAITE